MGFVFAVALLGSIGTADAGQLQVTARSPVVVAIDGLPAGIAHLHTDDIHLLDPGPHRVTIRSFMGRLMAEGTFDIPDGERVVVHYDRTDRTVEAVERIPLTSTTESTEDHDHDAEPDEDAPSDAIEITVQHDHRTHPPEPTSTPTPVERSTPQPTAAAEPPLPPAPAASSEGPVASSLVITGLSDISGAVRIDGQPVQFTSDADGFLASGLVAPLVEAHITDNGILRFHGAVQLEPGQHTSCHLHYRSPTWALDCEADGEVRLASTLGG